MRYDTYTRTKGLVTDAWDSLFVDLLARFLVEKIHLGEQVDVRQFQTHHGRQCRHDASHVLTGTHHKLRVQEKHRAESKVPPLELVHQSLHQRDVGVELNLSCRLEGQHSLMVPRPSPSSRRESLEAQG